MLKFWEHIIGGIFLICMFCKQRRLRQMLITINKCKKKFLTVYHLFSLNILLYPTMVNYRQTIWQHMDIILCNGHPFHTYLHNLTFVLDKILHKLFLK